MANTTGKKFGGRTKGTPNKSTQEIRNAYQMLLENNIPNLIKWLDKIAEKDPVKAFDIIIKMSDFIIPRLSRQQVEDVTDLETLLQLTPEERAQRIKDIKAKLDKK